MNGIGKYIKLFEKFINTQSEGRSVYTRNEKILQDKSMDVEYMWHDVIDVFHPIIRLIGNYENVGNDHATTYTMSLNDSRNNQLVSISIWNNPGERAVGNVWKRYGVSIDSIGISKISRMVRDASDYVGGIDVNRLEPLLLKLSSKESTEENNKVRL